MTEPKLKPCPFCGEQPLPYTTLHGEPALFCDNCSNNGKLIYTPADAWNTRASGWISVEDGLPLEFGWCVVRCAEDSETVFAVPAWFEKTEDGGPWWLDGHNGYEFNAACITHWMPMPSPEVMR